MPDLGQLNVNDRVLLHLSRFATDIVPEERPGEITQAGIAAAVGISRTHVPRAVKNLMKERLAEEITTRVRGHERRMCVYVISQEGLTRANDLWQKLMQTTFRVIADGKEVQMTGAELEARAGKKKALAAVSQARNGVVEIDRQRRPPMRDLGAGPAPCEFHGRDAELGAMDSFMDSDARVLVVLGNRGYGTTALAREFVESQDESDLLWISLETVTSPTMITDMLVSFGQRIDKSIIGLDQVLALDNLLLVFDGYFSVPEEMVEFLSGLVDSVKGAKVIITAREETPAYSWFYHRKQVDSGLVQELRLKGLDPKSARTFLGNEKVENDAFRRIMMMTRGQPMTLKMLRDGDEKGLRKNTVFTAEEIRYLLFLKNKTE